MTKRVLPPANLHERVARTDAVLSRYRDHAFSWAERKTCIHLFRAQAAAMGERLPPMPQFRSALGARRALEARGVATVVELLDQLLPGKRIAPAHMWVGDMLAVPGEDGRGLEALWIFGGGKMLGWHGLAETMVAVELSKAEWRDAILGAWRLG